jgi:hypothetical protein
VFSNSGILREAVMRALACGALLINYDRGELVDTNALALTLANGGVGSVAIDADIFVQDNTVTGPLQPYLALADAYPERVHLLPHAAADTDHPSRVAGAMQAVDQIIAAIRYRRLSNIVGDVPEGYTDDGVTTLAGIGTVCVADLQRLAAEPEALASLRVELAALDEMLVALQRASTQSGSNGFTPAPACYERGIAAGNRLTTALLRAGMIGPFSAGAVID